MAAAADKHWHGGNKAQGWEESLIQQNEQKAAWVTRQADWRKAWLQRAGLEIKVETSWFKEAKGQLGRQGWKHQWLEVSVKEEYIREDPEMVEEAAGSEWP